jgi:leucyl-tRNA synthetase
MAPTHEFVDQLVTDIQREYVENYRNLVKAHWHLEKILEMAKKKLAYLPVRKPQPCTGKLVPIYLSDYVLQIMVRVSSWQYRT